MQHEHTDLSPEQWEFLAAMKAIGQPVSVDIVVQLCPLAPGMLLNLVRVAGELGWLTESNDSMMMRLNDDLPPEIASKLDGINTPQRLSSLVSGLDLTEVPPEIRTTLLEKSARHYEAALQEMELFRQSMAIVPDEKGVQHVVRGLSILEKRKGQRECDALLIEAALNLVMLLPLFRDHTHDIPQVMQQARLAAQRLDDRRSLDLINLTYAVAHIWYEQTDEPLQYLEEGIQALSGLEDEVIQSQSSYFKGMRYYIQGHYREALGPLEQAMQVATARGDTTFMGTIATSLAHCAALLGQFHRAVGVMDGDWRRAQIIGSEAYAMLSRSSLGLILLMMGCRDEARTHIDAVLQSSSIERYPWAYFKAQLVRAYLLFQEGRVRESHARLYTCMSQVENSWKAPRIIFPWFWEMLFEFRQLGFEPLPGYDFDTYLQRKIDGCDIHIKGVALRLRAREAVLLNESPSVVHALLKESEDLLERSGNLIELGKTRIDLVRLHLRLKSKDEALKVALQAWENLAGYGKELFPEDLKPLLRSHGALCETQNGKKNQWEWFIETVEELLPGGNQDELLTRLLAVTSRLFEAERGALFLAKDNNKSMLPVVRAMYNITKGEVASEGFRSNLLLVQRALKNKQPLIIRPSESEIRRAEFHPSSILCLPLEYHGQVCGVLYHENTYTTGGFDVTDRAMLMKVAGHVSRSIERIESYVRILEKNSIREQRNLTDEAGVDLVTESPLMQQLLQNIARVARSDATVLILGETGAGKELIAGRLHRLSERSKGPFVVVDPGSMPENLVESELFGYEKGAFTGADRHKPGRMELAHGGTLFIDEVGDIPGEIQTKLLRALQEKRIQRVGSIRSIASDFRLVAATNRDLAAEVAAGNFREDLYFRLNVVPITIPPLRERGSDVLVLAEHFLRHYSRKYHRQGLCLSAKNRQMLQGYNWPGNVRELKNVMERAVILSNSDTLELTLQTNLRDGNVLPLGELIGMDELQRRYIRWVLEKTAGKISGRGGAAQILGMKPSTLNSRIKKLGIR